MNDLLPFSKQIIQNLTLGSSKIQITPASATTVKSTVDCSSVSASDVSTITSIDLINSMLYARHRILHDKCETLQASGVGVTWQNIIPDGTVPYACPTSLMTGSSGGSTSTCYYGHCAFATQDECLKHSKLPYDSTGKMIPDNANNFYMEWRTKPGGTPGEMGCYLGNYAFRRWCEIPQSRNPDKPDTDSQDALVYTANGPTGGTCALTSDYCHHKNLHWDEGSQTCYRTDGQKFAEALFGQTIDAFFTGNCGGGGGGSNSSSSINVSRQPRGSREGWAPREEERKFRKLADRRLKERITNLAPDYGGKGVGLYLYFYTSEALTLHPGYKKMQLGFMADEIEKLYPEIIEQIDGRKYISFSEAQLKEKRYWRIINTIKNEHILFKSLMDRFALKPVAASNAN